MTQAEKVANQQKIVQSCSKSTDALTIPREIRKRSQRKRHYLPDHSKYCGKTIEHSISPATPRWLSELMRTDGSCVPEIDES